MIGSFMKKLLGAKAEAIEDESKWEEAAKQACSEIFDKAYANTGDANIAWDMTYDALVMKELEARTELEAAVQAKLLAHKEWTVKYEQWREWPADDVRYKANNEANAVYKTAVAHNKAVYERACEISRAVAYARSYAPKAAQVQREMLAEQWER